MDENLEEVTNRIQIYVFRRISNPKHFGIFLSGIEIGNLGKIMDEV